MTCSRHNISYELHVWLVFMCSRVDTCINKQFSLKFFLLQPLFEKLLDPRLYHCPFWKKNLALKIVNARFIYLLICHLSIYLFIYPSVHPSIYPVIHVFTSLSPSVCSSVHFSIDPYLFIHLFTCTYFSRSVPVFIFKP